LVLTGSRTPDCAGYLVETLAGAVTGCRVIPPGFQGTEVAAAADGSIVGSGERGLGDTTSVTLMRPDGQLVVVDSSPYDFDPAISPDGSKVAFARYEPPYNPIDGPTDIFVVNSDGSGLKEVASGDGLNQLTVPTFSPDGNTIAYSCAPSGAVPDSYKTAACGPLPDGSYRAQTVLLMNANGTNKRVILIGGGNSLSWSPDGQWIATDGSSPCTCPGGNTGSSQVFVYHTDGSDLFKADDPTRQVTHETDLFGAILPQFGADGTQLVYLKSLDDKGTEGNFTYVINRDGSNRHEVAMSPEGDPWGKVIETGGEGPPPTVNAMLLSVPSVRTLSYQAAKHRLQRANLSVGKIRRRYSSHTPRNHVLGQYPRAGADAHRTTKRRPGVNLTLSRGPHK
jgi:PASTA domain/WD40-like Beta Propeller Repeat